MATWEEIMQTYQIMNELGSGGGGTVYLAYHFRLEKYVVLKKIHSELEGNVNVRTETDILKNLRHSYLPQVLDFLNIEGGIYTVMDYIPGESFGQILERGVMFTPAQVLKYTKQLAEAVAYLHSQRIPIVHGDIKPDNIMLTPEDNICLIDFNISGFFKDGYSSATGYTPGYSAPEQYYAVEAIKQQLQTNQSIPAGMAYQLTREVDIYSIGATMYHLLTGYCPSMNPSENYEPKAYNPQISDGLNAIVIKCMSYQPRERFSDGAALVKALENLHKYDKEYKRMLVRQEIAYVFLLVMMVISVQCVFIGKNRMDEEKVDAYAEIIEEMADVREELDEKEFDKLYQDAVSWAPDKVDAYYERALLLNQLREYEACIAFIEDEILDKDFEKEELYNVYFILGDCYFQLEDYETAMTYYKTAIKINNTNSECYRDYAIALVFCDEMEEAKEVLEECEDLGLENADIMLVQAEILAAEGQIEEALEYFERCAEEADGETLLRAYVFGADAFKQIEENEENLLRAADWLEEGIEQVEEAEQVLLLEKLAQCYADLSELAGGSYGEQALEVFETILDKGWGTTQTYFNMAILYQNHEQYEDAELILTKLLEEDDEDYRIYKRLAVLELDRQQSVDNSERDYTKAAEYYEEMMKLYDKQKHGSDAELMWLEQMYEELVDGGWIED